MGFTGGINDIGAGTDTNFIGACTPALKSVVTDPEVSTLLIPKTVSGHDPEPVP